MRALAYTYIYIYCFASCLLVVVGFVFCFGNLFFRGLATCQNTSLEKSGNSETPK